MRTLKDALIWLMGSESNTNQTGLTLSPEGWGVTFQPADLGNREVMIISKPSLIDDFAGGQAWDALMIAAACEWIETNVGDWTQSQDE